MLTALITGSGGGFGRALTKAFAKEGYNLILHYHNQKNAPMIRSGTSEILIPGDLEYCGTIDELTRCATEMKLNVLVNNAGQYHRGEFQNSPVDRIIAVNLTSAIKLTSAVWPILRSTGGCVVNIGSVATRAMADGEAIYRATKAGLEAFSESIQFEAARDGISVVYARLGAMNTGMGAGRQDADKLIDPDEAADVVVGLCKKHKTLKMPDVTMTRRNY